MDPVLFAETLIKRHHDIITKDKSRKNKVENRLNSISLTRLSVNTTYDELCSRLQYEGDLINYIDERLEFYREVLKILKQKEDE